MIREMVRDFVREEVEPQALEHDRDEKFNLALFRQLGEYGLLGITISEEYGGAGMDVTAAAIVNEELSYSDPGFCLAYLAHAQLTVSATCQDYALGNTLDAWPCRNPITGPLLWA